MTYVLRPFLVLTGFLAFSIPALGQTGQKLTASDGAENAEFGTSVAVSGDVALVGAPRDNNGSGSTYGSAYVYRYDGSQWVEAQKLTASDAAAGDRFGISVALSGDVALVGAKFDDDSGSASGSAYVYRYDGSEWVEAQKLTASDGAAGDQFGVAVALSGNVAVVGAPFGDAAAGGSAYVFRYDGSEWVEAQKLTASDGATDNDFGGSVAVSGDVALVFGASDDSSGSYGSVYVYRYDGSQWVEVQKLTASDAAADDSFGNVALSGDVALVGAPGDDDNGDDSGSAYVFRYDGSEWVETQKLTASDAAAGFLFGFSVAVSGDVALVGSPLGTNSFNGSAYVFRYDGSEWVEAQKLVAGGVGHFFGFSVALSGNVALVGVPQDNDNGSGSGSAYVYDLGSGVSTEPGTEGPGALALHGFPNPSAGQATLRFAVAEAGPVRLVLYDALGREVTVLHEGVLPAGDHEVAFDGARLPGGVYLVRLTSGRDTIVRRLTLVH